MIVVPLINPTPATWAAATTSIIFQNGPPESKDVEAAIQATLESSYRLLIGMEQELLRQDPEQCQQPYGLEALASEAVRACQTVAADSPYSNRLLSDEWSDAAYRTIGDHMATAVHVERLLFADQHPDNQAAMAYKARFNK